MNELIEIIENQKKNIVFIGYKHKTEKGEEIRINGSGFIYNKDGIKYIISAAHIHDEIPKNKLEIFAGIYLDVREDANSEISTYSLYKLELYKINKEKDIVIFKLPENSIIKGEGIHLENLIHNPKEQKDNIKQGMDILFLGFPLANDFINLKFGVTLFANKSLVGATKYNADRKEMDHIITDVQVNQNNGGSPVFNLDGKIIGIVSGILKRNINGIEIPLNIGFIKPISNLDNFIELTQK